MQRIQPRLVERKGAPAEWVEKRERGSPWLLRAMVRLSLALGRTVSRGILYLVALYFFVFAPGARRESRRYLRRALQRQPRAADRFRQLLHFSTCVHDRVYLLNEQYEHFDISIEGEPLMEAQLRSGAGAFLMGAHIGSFEVMHSLGRRQPSLNVTMAMFEQNASKINAILRAINPRANPDIIALGRVDAMLKIAERLDRGAFVGMLGDRTLADEPVQAVMLLGRRAYLPIGPFRVAAALRRRVIFMLGLYRGGNRYHIVFAPLADFSSVVAGKRDAALREAVDRYAKLLEHYCRSDPYNWFNFYDFWQEHDAGP
jgi:predicted LPLAT superfamily acyltransferase